MFAVTILGNNSAVPAFDRHPTSQVVTLNGTNYLVDCGEGTQIQLINYKIRRSKISHIFISHLHGDHYFGLVGLINSLSHRDRLSVVAFDGTLLVMKGAGREHEQQSRGEQVTGPKASKHSTGADAEQRDTGGPEMARPGLDDVRSRQQTPASCVGA